MPECKFGAAQKFFSHELPTFFFSHSISNWCLLVRYCFLRNQLIWRFKSARIEPSNQIMVHQLQKMLWVCSKALILSKYLGPPKPHSHGRLSWLPGPFWPPWSSWPDVTFQPPGPHRLPGLPEPLGPPWSSWPLGPPELIRPSEHAPFIDFPDNLPAVQRA